MATRIRRAWEELPVCTAGMDQDSPIFLQGVRDWVRTSVPRVSKLVVAALPKARGIAVYLRGDVDCMAARRSAVRDLLAAAERDRTRNPERFLKVVDGLVGELAIFKNVDDGCPRCQSGDLGMWSDEGGQIFFVCDFMGCAHDRNLQPWLIPLDELRPASRAQVQAWYPEADLLGSSGAIG